MIYLDNNATTPLDPRVEDCMRQASKWDFNPSSQHGFGRAAKQRLETARESILELLGARTTSFPGDQLVITSGGTESNNLALFGLAGRPPSRILVSAIEHPSVLRAADRLSTQGFEVLRLPVGRDGRLRLEQLDEALRTPTRLVSLMLANHETGVIQPVREAIQLCHARGALVHTDAVQLVGKGRVHFQELGCDALTFAPHKFHGPRGVGGLLVRGGLHLTPLLVGGPQQLGLRAGTESVSLAMGMECALRIAVSEGHDRPEHLRLLRDALQDYLVEHIDQVEIIGASQARAPQTLCVAFPGIDRQALVMALDRAGVACSSGAACASGSSEPSPVLQASHLSAEIVRSAIRLSVGVQTTAREVAEAARIVAQTVAKLRKNTTISH